tara:strand:- start:778 stop:1923 length:1146 start_codon:yes stop_codon:yes gene_type:complete
LGIVIGIAAVIVMTAVGEGAKKKTLDEIEKMGKNLIIINAGEVKMRHGVPRIRGNVTSLKTRDSKKILENSQYINKAAPSHFQALEIKYGNGILMSNIVGTTPEFLGVRNFDILSGHFFTMQDLKSFKRVAVIGESVAKDLFVDDDPIDKVIKIRKIPFRVIGITRGKGMEADGRDEDNQVFIPISTALRRLFNQTYISTIYAQATEKDDIVEAVKEVKEILRIEHKLPSFKDDDFTIRNQLELIKTKEETARIFTMLIAGVAAISLLVAGIGILAVMMISVRERTLEIGIRRAVGAKERDILTQFLVESLILSLNGGIVGLALGLIISYVVSATTKWDLIVPDFIVVISFLVTLLIGLFFGVYPARKAAALNPIDALKCE